MERGIQMIDFEAIGRAAAVLTGASYPVGFTGAGVSAASGIPTFRAESGIWTRFPIEEYGTAEAFAHDPEKAWKLFGALTPDLEAAQPNPAHVAMAELEAKGRLKALVTQNIDGLHQRAGSRQVIEFHGTCESGHCYGCDRAFVMKELPAWPPAPRCPDCNTVVKPDVVLFGDQIPAEAMADAGAAFTRCDAVLVVGSSLQVPPASWLVIDAGERGKSIIIVDPEPSFFARKVATLTIAAPAEQVLPEIVSRVV
jgi:NAD-dependent deacetylase